MILNGIASKQINDILTDKYASLINDGVSSKEILVLVQNSTARKKFIAEILNKIEFPYIENLNIHSFGSLVYNTVYNSWGYLENKSPNSKILFEPNLVGLEVSQFLLKQILKDVEVKGYNSKKSLLHQIFRRYSLIVQNNLNAGQIEIRSKILKEPFADDAKQIIDKFISKTFHAKSYDYLRQMLIFNHIYQSTDYFSDIKYLLAEDADEMPPVELDFIEYLNPKLKNLIIAFDDKGSSRCGYLGADKSVKKRLEDNFSDTIVEIKSPTNPDADKIYENVVYNKESILNTFSLCSPSKRPQMIEEGIKKISELLKSGVLPNEISVVTPNVDDMLKFCFKEQLKSAKTVFISGNEKLIDVPIIRAAINILKLACSFLDDEFEFRIILTDFFKIPIKYCFETLDNFSKTHKLIFPKNSVYKNEFEKLVSLIEKLKPNSALSDMLCTIYKEIPKDTPKTELIKYNFLVKQMKDFETTISLIPENNSVTKTEKLLSIIKQIENSIISENPNTTLDISQNEIVVATPQKLIDNKIKTKYQIWLDVSSSDWIKNDTGPLYNSWVFQSAWNKPEYTIDDDIQLTKNKTARVLRKLLLLNTEKVNAFSSLFDSSGCENFGGIEKYIFTPTDKKNNKIENCQKFIPRDDQEEILNYKSGKMAITAVPGAGKTTVLLELVINLLNNGINPENIFVLTYMESAARNFRDKIKNSRKDDIKLPNISTIHGLALRIIKENSNFERIGLPADFDICDEAAKLRIIKSIANGYNKNEREEFERGISNLKLSSGKLPKTHPNPKIMKFVDFYNLYQSKLKEAGLIDYDDILVSSVKLLEENEDIKNYYADICKFIIEDEAQDSSEIQQRLLNLLSSKYGNLVRCGDINQAITASFSNSDIKGFKNYIKTSKNVTMNRSQRCAKDIYELANKLVDYGNSFVPEAFFDVKMRSVLGKNPVTKNAVSYILFNNDFAEKNYILKQIREILAKEPEAKLAILLRSNYRVGTWTNFISNSGLKCITRSECLEQKLVYRFIFAVLDFINAPFDNSKVINLYDIFVEYGLADFDSNLAIKNCKSPFLLCNPDEIEDEKLAKFYWEIEYLASLSSLTPDAVALKISELYFGSDIEKANTFLIAILIKRLYSQGHTMNYLIENLSELAKRPNLSGFKFFAETETEIESKDLTKGKVQIMTMHKSKGDEFDYVFIPELKEKSLPINPDTYSIKKVGNFSEDIKGLSASYIPKSLTELKSFLISENMRLLYVAITRAKRKLYISCSKSNSEIKKQNNNTTTSESIIFKNLLNL